MDDAALAALYPSMAKEGPAAKVDTPKADAPQDAASRMFPSMNATPAPAAPETPKEPLTQQIADQLFKPKEPQRAPDDAIPQSVRELREADTERKMFGAQGTHKEAISEKDIEGDGITDDQKAAVAAEYREMFADAGLSVPEAQEVVTLARALAANPPTPETEAQWIQQAEKRLLEMNNGNAAAAAADAALARKLVQRDPRVAKILDATRLGNSPRMIELMLELARDEKSRGRLS